MNKIIALIPARYQSTRLPGKPLKQIGNKTLIQIIYENAKKSDICQQVIIATDDKRIMEKVKSFGGNAFLSQKPHKTGTDRIAEVARSLEADIFINIQGDEIFIKKKELLKLISGFDDNNVNITTLIHPLQIKEHIQNPNKVKVIFDKSDNAIYFSRFPIPYKKGKFESQYWGHIGIYGFRKDILMKYTSLPQSTLEKTEDLEQLRLIENGYKIKVVKIQYPGFGIDTPEDLEKVRSIYKNS